MRNFLCGYILISVKHNKKTKMTAINYRLSIISTAVIIHLKHKSYE